jgi:peptidase E
MDIKSLILGKRFKMKPTAFVYSTHDRSEYIHRDWIVQKALESHDNKTLIHLPWSQYKKSGQEWDYDSFKYFYNRYSQYGLNYIPFFWEDNYSEESVHELVNWLTNAQVVVLGGGNPALGMKRFHTLGAKYFGDPWLFHKILHDRQNRGLYSVGFSAGADQLCEYMWGAIDTTPQSAGGLGLCHNVLVSLHYEYGGGEYIAHTAQRMPHCFSFGLPNDSGLGIDQGVLPSGNIWQMIWFVTDNSWDVPEDEWHIKTRSGEKIQHYYSDGRDWRFNGGDKMLRIMSADNRWQDAWIIDNQGQMFDYYTQSPSGYHNIEHILSVH